MNLKKLDNNGFGLIEVLVTVIVLTLVIFAGFYIANNGKDSDSDNSTKAAKTASPTPAKPRGSTSETDKAQIIAAAKSYSAGGANQSQATITVNDIVGANAQGHVSDPAADLSAAFIAHKADGKWQVIFEGQQAPDSDIGKKYDLPADWYAAD